MLPSGSIRVKVYAGIDPVTKKRHYLDEVITAGPKAAKEAEKARTRLLAQVDERRNPRTRATVNQMLDRYLSVLDVEPTTKSNLRGLHPQPHRSGARPAAARPAGNRGRRVVLRAAADLPRPLWRPPARGAPNRRRAHLRRTVRRS